MNADIIDFKIWRDVRLAERALAGDVDAAILAAQIRRIGVA